MLRQAQQNGNIISDIKSLPFVTSMNSVQALSVVEGFPRDFQDSARSCPNRFCRWERFEQLEQAQQLNGLNFVVSDE